MIEKEDGKLVCSITDLHILSNNSYADFLLAKGVEVYELGCYPWMKYHGALIPATAMPVYAQFSTSEAERLISKSKALLLRYTKGPVQAPTNWWNMVCRNYNFSNVSSNTRSKIRRGIKRHKISQAHSSQVIDQAYECHVESHKRYRNAFPESRNSYNSFLNEIVSQSIFNIWICSKGSKIVGYIICLVEEDGVFLHTIDITPEGLQDYASYALIHNILDYYVNEKKLPVSNGSRSIAHETDMQDYLRKFGFNREYSELHVIYRPDIKFIVKLLYPLRSILKPFSNVPIIHKVSAILYQEEIVRRRITDKVIYE